MYRDVLKFRSFRYCGDGNAMYVQCTVDAAHVWTCASQFSSSATCWHSWQCYL